jgi:XTP/dITP diphosphohydrolase
MLSLLKEKPLVIASHNQGKVAEIRALLAPLAINVVSAADKHVSEPDETGATFAENARLKSRHSALATGLPALSDDSGLAIPALGGAPGIYSARWAGAGKDFSVAFLRIQNELVEKQLATAPAYFVCTLSLSLPDGKDHLFEGRIDGMLTFPPRGDLGFGYDPIFIPDGYNDTFAEIDAAEKNRISHRAKAFAKFLKFIGSGEDSDHHR